MINVEDMEKEDLYNLDYISSILQQLFYFPSYIDVTKLFDNDIQIIKDDLGKTYFKTNRFKFGIYSKTDLLCYKEMIQDGKLRRIFG